MNATERGDEAIDLKYNAEDPTETKRLRSEFQSAIERRWDTVREDLQRWFSELDDPLPYPRLRMRFRNWFSQRIHEAVLEQAADTTINNGRHWTGNYVRQAYRQGLQLAKRDLQEIGTPQRQIRQATRPRASHHHDPRVQQYQYAYLGLADQMSRAIDEAGGAIRRGIDQQEDRQWFVKEVNGVIDDILVAGRAHANTVIVETVNRALLAAFRFVGVEEVGIAPESRPGSASVNAIRVNQPPEDGPDTVREAVSGGGSSFPDPSDPREPDELQFVTAGDEKVCPECRRLAGTIVDIEGALGSEGKLSGALGSIIPVHVNCRCRWVPLPPTSG